MAKSVNDAKVVSKDVQDTDYDTPTAAKDFLAFLNFREDKNRRLANQREKIGALKLEKQAEERRRKRLWTKLFPIPKVVPVIQIEDRCCLAQLNGDQWIRCSRPYSSYSNTKLFQDKAVRRKVPIAVDSQATHSNICIYHHNVVNFCKRGQDCYKEEYLFLEYELDSKIQIDKDTFINIKEYESQSIKQSPKDNNEVANGKVEAVQLEITDSTNVEATTSKNTQVMPTVEVIADCCSDNEEQYEDIYRVIEHVQEGININEEAMSDCSTFEGEIEVEDGEFDEIIIEEVEYQPPSGQFGEYLTYNNELDVDKWNSDGILKYIDDTINRPTKEEKIQEEAESDTETLSTSSEGSCSSEEPVFSFKTERSAKESRKKHKRTNKKASLVLNIEEKKHPLSTNYSLEDATFFDGRDIQELIDEIPGGAEADNIRAVDDVVTSFYNEDLEFRSIVEYRVHGDATHWMDQLKTPRSAKEEETSESEAEKEDITEVPTGLDTLSAASLRRYRAYFNIPTNSGFTKSRMLQGVEAHLRATPVNTVHSIAAFLNTEVRDLRPEDYEALEEEDEESGAEYEEELIDEEESESSDGPHRQQKTVEDNGEKKETHQSGNTAH